MKPVEDQLCNAIQLMLESSVELGVPKNDQLDHSAQYLHEHIGDLFRTKIADLVHYDPISAAFAKVHGYKMIGDPSFWFAMERELKAMAVPLEEQTKVASIIENLAKENKDEQSSGYHKELDEILNQNKK